VIAKSAGFEHLDRLESLVISIARHYLRPLFSFTCLSCLAAIVISSVSFMYTRVRQLIRGNNDRQAPVELDSSIDLFNGDL